MAGTAKFSGKTVVVGITGGIAAYKSAEIVRWFKKQDAAVVCVLTPAARRFVSPLTLETLSANPVVTSLWKPVRPLNLGPRPKGRKSPVEHIEIADAADLIVVAPATADFMARVAIGRADDALTSTLLATRAPVLLAPAMNVNMWNHPATQGHLETLLSRGIEIVEPEEGELACRWEGQGRLADIAQITARATSLLARTMEWQGRHVVVTAGPTREALDPVRYLSNHSSGKMGYRIAEAARDRGARVSLISGPVEERPPAGVDLHSVTSAAEMKRAVNKAVRKADAVVMAAAVADYKPRKAAAEKISRESSGLELKLESTPDILMELPRTNGLVVVGFALETSDGVKRARAKLRKKNCDLMVLNDPTQEGSEFGGDTNRVTLIDAQGKTAELPTMSKRQVADQIWDRVERLWTRRKKSR